ncbi:hypothetical protein BZL30_8707 [Mycobacterium kansasii]|uniref:Uncharacterized protein n=1 Tax=Mycobacterium kansasii TaxID=1768 RepID=A0A1V3WFG5_MYCKA|nr:hypothetical protein BZL30_8707 [Mycobacterium kansasii]
MVVLGGRAGVGVDGVLAGTAIQARAFGFGLHMRHPSNATDLPLIAGHFQ